MNSKGGKSGLVEMVSLPALTVVSAASAGAASAEAADAAASEAAASDAGASADAALLLEMQLDTAQPISPLTERQYLLRNYTDRQAAQLLG